jgi:hypothetical protein
VAGHAGTVVLPVGVLIVLGIVRAHVSVVVLVPSTLTIGVIMTLF